MFDLLYSMAGIFAPLSVLDGRRSSVYFYMQVAHCCWASFCELIPQIDEFLMSDQEFCRLTLLVSGCPKSWCKTSKPHHRTLAFYLQCSSKDGGITLINCVRRNLIWLSALTTSLPHQCSFLCFQLFDIASKYSCEHDWLFGKYLL